MSYVAILVGLLKGVPALKTYLAPVGLIGLAVYYIVSSDDPTYGVKVLLEGLSVLGIGHAVAAPAEGKPVVPNADIGADPITVWKE